MRFGIFSKKALLGWPDICCLNQLVENWSRLQLPCWFVLLLCCLVFYYKNYIINPSILWVVLWKKTLLLSPSLSHWILDFCLPNTSSSFSYFLEFYQTWWTYYNPGLYACKPGSLLWWCSVSTTKPQPNWLPHLFYRLSSKIFDNLSSFKSSWLRSFFSIHLKTTHERQSR